MSSTIEGHRAPDAASGLPAGGASGQVLQKNSSANYDAAWADPPEPPAPPEPGPVTIINPSQPSPPADGKNLCYYRFDDGALEDDSGDYAGGPWPLSDSFPGSIVQQDSSVSPLFGKEITGGGAADYLSPGVSNFAESDLADGFTVYLGFHAPVFAAFSNNDVIPLYQRGRASGAFMTSKALLGIALYKNTAANASQWTLQVLVSNAAGDGYIAEAVGAGSPGTGLDEGAEYRLVLTVGPDGKAYSVRLNEEVRASGNAANDVRTGWAADDNLKIFGGTGVIDWTVFGATPKGPGPGTALDNLLWRQGVDDPLVVFDETFTGGVAGVPAGVTAPGSPGQLAYDGDYLYVCVAVDTWKRAALSGW